MYIEIVKRWKQKTPHYEGFFVLGGRSGSPYLVAVEGLEPSSD